MHTNLYLAAEQATQTPWWASPDWWAFIAAVAALTTSVIALIFNKQSAKAAQSSADTAKEAATYAKDSAGAANVSANAAADLLRVELTRQHEEYRPRPNGSFTFTRRMQKHIIALEYRFVLDREYTVLATASANNGQVTTVCTVTAPALPDSEWVVHVEDWSPDRTASAWQTLTLRFWPPQPREGRARPWVCLCGLSLGGGDDAAHWDFEVRIKPPPRPKSPQIITA